MLLCWIGTLNSYDYYYYDYEKDEKTCNCINPFANTADRNLGNPDILCNLRPSQRRCYIEAYKNCTDSQKASGIRRWTSKIAIVSSGSLNCANVFLKSCRNVLHPIEAARSPVILIVEICGKIRRMLMLAVIQAVPGTL